MNDSLVMIDFSVTTFLGFTPLILERSIQAQFVLPFAASLGIGILITTFVLMLVVPAVSTIHLSLIKPSSVQHTPVPSMD